MRNVVVLGAGRSGASLVAGTLAPGGYGFAVDPIESADPQIKRSFQCRRVLEINERILHKAVPPRVGRKGPSSIPVRNQYWLAPVPEHVPMWCDETIMEGIAELVQRQPYCYVDPRFCYTLDVWRPMLDNAVFVCVFRHPAAAAASMVRHVQTAPYLQDLSIDFDQALEVWRAMYQYVLHQHVEQGDWMFVEFDQMYQQPTTTALAKFVESEIDPNFPQHPLQHQIPDHPVGPRSWTLYQQLRELSGQAPA